MEADWQVPRVMAGIWLSPRVLYRYLVGGHKKRRGMRDRLVGRNVPVGAKQTWLCECVSCQGRGVLIDLTSCWGLVRSGFISDNAMVVYTGNQPPPPLSACQLPHLEPHTPLALPRSRPPASRPPCQFGESGRNTVLFSLARHRSD